MSTYKLVQVLEPSTTRKVATVEGKVRSSLQKKVLNRATVPSINHNVVIKYAVSQKAIHDVHLLVASTQRGICAVLLSPTSDAATLLPDLKRRFKRHERISKATSSATDSFTTASLENLVLVESLLSQREPCAEATALRTQLEARLDLHGTSSQLRVWQALLAVPTGETITYAELAQKADMDAKACRAVAQACGANHVALIVPCHRAVPKSGGLGGYHWGSELKRQVLRSEGVQL